MIFSSFDVKFEGKNKTHKSTKIQHQEIPIFQYFELVIQYWALVIIQCREYGDIQYWNTGSEGYAELAGVSRPWVYSCGSGVSDLDPDKVRGGYREADEEA